MLNFVKHAFAARAGGMGVLGVMGDMGILGRGAKALN